MSDIGWSHKIVIFWLSFQILEYKIKNRVLSFNIWVNDFIVPQISYFHAQTDSERQASALYCNVKGLNSFEAPNARKYDFVVPCLYNWAQITTWYSEMWF